MPRGAPPSPAHRNIPWAQKTAKLVDSDPISQCSCHVVRRKQPQIIMWGISMAPLPVLCMLSQTEIPLGVILTTQQPPRWAPGAAGAQEKGLVPLRNVAKQSANHVTWS